jgi:hypothetical protein
VRVVVHQIDGVSTLQALPLAAGLLVASARLDRRVAAEAELRIETARRDPAEVIEGYGEVDVLAFSTYVWNQRYSLELARRARERYPRALVVLGGPSVPRRPERAAELLRRHPWIDVLAFGEGEVAFRELLRALLDGAPLDGVAGLAVRGAGLTAARARVSDFAGGTASPYLDGTFDAMAATSAAILETNRGCPFACTFCDWGQAVASRVNELPLERVHGELAWIAARKIPYVYIVDANYGMRRRDLDIVREIGRLRGATGFPQYVFFHLTKNATERHLEVVLALREAGIATHLALSAQDFEPRVLAAVKRDNIRLDRALELRRVCHQRGIPTFNEMILGLPEQTYASFARGMVKAVTPYPGDAFQLYLARVLENAEMASPEQRARHGLVTREVLIASFHRQAPSEGAHVAEVEEVVVGTRAMPEADWRRAFKLGFFLAAAHNLKLLDAVLQVAWRVAGIDLVELLEKLMARLARAPSASALGRVEAALARHAEAVLGGSAMVLPAEGTGDHLWAVEDAVALEALRDGAAFYDELAAFAREELPALEEAVRWQRLVTPWMGATGRRRDELGHDYAGWRARVEGPLEARATRVGFTPSPSLLGLADARQFMLAYLGLVHARLPTGTLGPG